MFKFVAQSTIITLAILLAACGDSTESKGVIPKGQLEALEKAENVENMLMDAQKNRLQEVDG